VSGGSPFGGGPGQHLTNAMAAILHRSAGHLRFSLWGLRTPRVIWAAEVVPARLEDPGIYLSWQGDSLGPLLLAILQALPDLSQVGAPDSHQDEGRREAAPVLLQLMDRIVAALPSDACALLRFDPSRDTREAWMADGPEAVASALLEALASHAAGVRHPEPVPA
jgi:hypothetical protein